MLKGLTLSFDDKRVSVLLGPSGCGKTTLLNILSAVVRSDSGTIEGLDGLRVSYLFQEPRLLPWATVAGNIDLVLRDTYDEPERGAIIRRFLHLVGLSKFERFYPDALSGGMRQRVAVARAFAFPGDLLLMDEPFQALDLVLKLSLMDSFETLWKEDMRTAVFVTHDIQEALLAGDDIYVLSSRPAQVVSHLRNDVPRSERSLRNDGILELERTLYGLFGLSR